MQKTILCYGDSNTWGYIPNRLCLKLQRYAYRARWPSLLQAHLGTGYHVIAEGLNGRTTDLDYAIAPDRNGKRYLPICLYSHAPIDLVILALGGNDLKTYFNRSAAEIRDGLAELIQIIQTSNYGKNFHGAPAILILAQSIPLPIAEKLSDPNGTLVFKNAVAKAKQLVELYAQLAKETSCYFLDINKEIFPSKLDGIHLTKQGHKQLGLRLSQYIVTLKI